MREQLTETSAKHWDFVVQDDLTAQEIVEFLRSGIKLRTFSEVLAKIYPEPDLKERLYAEFPSRKNVQNWLKDRNLPTGREEVFRIAFALGLDEKQADVLLAYVFEEGIHYRNERELVYAFALKNHQNYETAARSAKTFLERKKEAPQDGTPQTNVIRMAFEALPPGEDFMRFLAAHSGQLGTRHNTAYRYFTGMLSLLRGDFEEEAYTTDAIAENYLRLHMPKERRTDDYDYVQKTLKKYWPGERSIRAMKNRREDISRKALLLLFIVTGGLREEGYDELDEEYISKDLRLAGDCRRINEMLELSGMRRLDPRNPFDFLVLYCLQAESGDMMSERMEAVVDELFTAYGKAPS